MTTIINLTQIQSDALHTLEVNNYCFKTCKMLLIGVMVRKKHKVIDISDYKQVSNSLKYEITYR